MGNLIQMDRCVQGSRTAVPPILASISTPLRCEAWAAELRAYPDLEYAQFFVKGIEHGFRIGFDYQNCPCVSAKSNMLSIFKPMKPIFPKELAGRIIGPLPASVEGVHVSNIGVIPKPHQPGKWRLVTDLSFPNGSSVNNGIDPQLCSLLHIH